MRLPWVLGLLGLGAIGAGLQQPQFRARSDAVNVDIAVLSGSRPVAGLTAADFALTDNGVPQQFDLSTLERLPVDVSMLLDASGSMRPRLGRVPAAMEAVRSTLDRDVRLELLAFDRTLRQVFTAAQVPVEWRPVTAGGSLSPRDALAMMMIRGGSAVGRRCLTIIFTDGAAKETDIIRPGRMPELARRYDGVVHVVLFADKANDEFADVTETTGGQLHRGGSPDDIAETFNRIFDSFRRSYVLRYVPAGVQSGGWHTIDVRIMRPGGQRYTVRSRKGYWWDETRRP